MVNIVTLPTGPKYALDVSFGGDGPTHPLTLIPGHTSRNLDVQQVRLIHDNIPHQTDLSQKLWIYQYRNGAERERNSFDPLALRQQIVRRARNLTERCPSEASFSSLFDMRLSTIQHRLSFTTLATALPFA